VAIWRRGLAARGGIAYRVRICRAFTVHSPCDTNVSGHVVRFEKTELERFVWKSRAFSATLHGCGKWSDTALKGLGIEKSDHL